ncbi:DUF600 family protein [Catenovulum sp. SM1970]|uniref:immunity protein YezG family protein n=1 Tax=Marinifaba aquimaris TaxID=2741323 RepID=UPI00157474FF|nr:immunity protein YezG family protein [Marinifaba aquimaris]NTS77887.1 DUF600 family protein [Marinifaba aquimaris]
MNVDEIYLEIVQKMVSSINDVWTEASINFEYLGDSAEYNGRYLKTDNKIQQYQFKVGYQTYKLFKQLHHITTENSENKWNRAKFTLEPSGKFNIDFEWDQDLADEIERLNNE